MPRYKKPWREDLRVLTRLPEVERRHLAGWPNTRIAKELKVSEGTIRLDLDRLAAIWLERTAGEQQALRSRYTAELDDVRIRALEAAEWDQTCEAAVLYGEAHPQYGSVYRDDKGSAQFRGQKAAALSAARQATMDKAKLNGLIVEKQEHQTPLPVRIYEVDTSGDGSGAGPGPGPGSGGPVDAGLPSA